MILEKIAKTLSDLDKEETISLTVQAILEGETPQKIVLRGLLAGLEEVAKRYGQKEHLYPDMYKAAGIFHETLAKIKHQIVAMETKPGLRGAIGVVHGDMQDFGKNIVHMTLEANGFDVKDLGKSVSTEEFLQAALEGAEFIGISIMTDAGVGEAKKVVQTFKDAGLREQVKVIVGGAGVNAQKAAEIIEADGYAEDAAEVVEFLKLFFQVKKDG
jgi:5-methyltetrahydrofolate--homocysteine methyltransferase